MSETLRVAILPISLSFFRDVEILTADGHFDGDVWIEPERRYEIGAVLKRLDLPKTWKIAQRGTHAAIWIDVVMRTLCITFESDEFPEVAFGEMPPKIDIALRNHCDEGRISFDSYMLR